MNPKPRVSQQYQLLKEKPNEVIIAKDID